MSPHEPLGGNERRPSQKQLRDFVNSIESFSNLLEVHPGIGLRDRDFKLEDGRIAIIRISNYEDNREIEVENAAPTYSLIIREASELNGKGIVADKDFSVFSYKHHELLDEFYTENHYLVTQEGETERIPSLTDKILYEAGILVSRGEDKDKILELYELREELIRENIDAGFTNLAASYAEAMRALQEIQEAHGIEPTQG